MSPVDSQISGEKQTPQMDREAFDAFVYTPIDEAIEELQRRENDPALQVYVNKILPLGLPEVMRGKKSIILFRHIATPNYEIRRFVMLANLIENDPHWHGKVEPLILEYLEDKFTNRNEWKYSLGRIFMHKGMNKKREAIFESANIIDFNASNVKPISSLKTLWDESLVGFHHDAFFDIFPAMQGKVSDLSEWLHENGGDARKYYKMFLTLFVKDAILLENFLLEKNESAFTTEVILPAFTEIYKETGVKPLIVALEPTKFENDRFWLSHPHEHMKGFLEKRRGNL